MAWQEGICNERSGFLFDHDCDRVPAVSCGQCGRPVCEEHLRMTDDGDRCITCQRQVPESRKARKHSVDEDGDESNYYYYDPYFYHHHYESEGAEYWGKESYAAATGTDANDFTEGDAHALQSEGNEGFETDMGGS